MQKVRTLLKYHDLTVEVESHPGDELIQHMYDTLLGMPGGFQYHHTNIADRLHSLDENYFLYLRKAGKMLGSVGFCGREVEVLNFKHEVWLVRYFSIKAPMRSELSGSSEQKAGEQKYRENSGGDQRESGHADSIEKRSSILGRFIKPIMSNPSYLRTGDEKSKEPGIIIGIIDRTNLRSMNFARSSGLESIGQISIFPFSRFRPKKSLRLIPLEDKERGPMIKLLNKQYEDYTLLTTENLFKNQDYFVIKEDNEIIAGLQAYEVTWKVVNFGSGPVNWLMNILSKIPFFRKRLDPKNLKLLAFDGIYVKEGHEKVLYELMEGVLAKKEVYLSLLIMDIKARMSDIFEKYENRGTIYKMLGTFNADVMAKFINIPDEVQAYYRQNPKYISSYDNS